MTDDGEGSGLRRLVKSDSAFRTISEVADELDVPQHVLRFWEGKFPQISPLKRAGGRRYYRPDDVVLLRRISELLYNEGYTIKGVQKLLREGALRSDVLGGMSQGDQEESLSVERETDAFALPLVAALEKNPFAFFLGDSGDGDHPEERPSDPSHDGATGGGDEKGRGEEPRVLDSGHVAVVNTDRLSPWEELLSIKEMENEIVLQQDVPEAESIPDQNDKVDPDSFHVLDRGALRAVLAELESLRSLLP